MDAVLFDGIRAALAEARQGVVRKNPQDYTHRPTDWTLWESGHRIGMGIAKGVYDGLC
jgi:hypothetical protein